MKNIKNYLLTALLAFTLAFGITGITTLTKASAETKLYANVNVGQDISLVISADVPNAATVTATFAWNGEKGDYSDTVVGEKQGETDTYKFFYRGLSAQYMAKEVAVTVYSGETEVATANVSVKGILDTYLSSSAKALGINANAYKKLTTLSADILNYGKAAESYLKLPDDIGEVTGGTTFVADETATSTIQGNLKWNAGITFDYNLRPAVKVYIPAETYKPTLVAKIDGKVATLTATETANVYTLTYSNYNILDIDRDYKFEIFDEDGTTSLGSYTSSLAALAKENNAEIVKAAYVYGKSVVKYASVLEDIDFVSEHFQAESVITVENDTTKKKSNFGIWEYTDSTGNIIKHDNTGIANGAENQYVQALSNNTAWLATLNVTVAKAGEYDLRGVMQHQEFLSLNGIYSVAVKDGADGVVDSDYAVSETNDYCLPASQWVDGYTRHTWCNAYYWTDASIGAVKLKEGENVIYIKAAKATTIPNIDYFYVKGFTTAEEKVTLVNTRKAFAESLGAHTAIGESAETPFMLKNGVALKELYKYKDGYPKEITGLYLIVPEMEYMGKVQTTKVPVTESMISGLDYNVIGEQKATVTYGAYSVEAYFYVYEAIIEAEDCAYTFENGNETTVKYDKVQSKVSADYYKTVTSGGTTQKVLDSTSPIHNGASGSGALKDLGSANAAFFKFKVSVPASGKYTLKARAQGEWNVYVDEKFSININGQADSNGYVFTKNPKGPPLKGGNRLAEYYAFADDEQGFSASRTTYWWQLVELGRFELEKGENEIRIYIPNGVNARIDYFEVTYCDSTMTSINPATAIYSVRGSNIENLYGKVLTINNGVKLTDIIELNPLHPVKYTRLYLRTSSGNDVAVLDTMLEGKVDYNKVGEQQLVTVTDPVSGESASFTLLIKA